MPHFRQFANARSNLGTNSPVPEGNYVELVWQNGQILPQGQSQYNRATMSGFPQSVSLPDEWSEDEARQKAATLQGMEVGMGELSAPRSGEIGLVQEDDMVPWLSYPFNGSLHAADFSPDLLPELPGIAGLADGGQPLVCKNLDSMRFLENSMGGEVIVARDGLTQPLYLNPSSSTAPLPQQLPLPFSPFTLRFLEDVGKAKAMVSEGLGRADEGSAFSNFPRVSHAANVFGPDTDDPKASVLDGAEQVDMNFSGSSGVKQSENIQDAGPVIADVSDGLHDRNKEENGKVGGRTGCGSIEAGRIAAEGEKNMNRMDSFAYSGNTIKRDACDPKLSLKRKSHDNGEPDTPSEPKKRGRGEQLKDADKELVCEKKEVPSSSRDTAAKRSRAAEVHNLSERRRRDRINEKMRTLQELIPNCSKADKASLLDEVIEYLKNLQIQAQLMMPMGAGMYMPAMMLPTGIHNMPHFPQLGLGMGTEISYGGMGLNAGSSVTHHPMVHIPPSVHGGNFPTVQHAMLPGAFSYPGQGIPMSMPRTSFDPISSVMTSDTNGYGMTPITPVSSSKEKGPRITTPLSTNFSFQGDLPPPQSDQIQSIRETSDENARDSRGPTITRNGK